MNRLWAPWGFRLFFFKYCSCSSSRFPFDSTQTSLFRFHILTALPFFAFFQGVRTKTVKKSARTIVEKYYTRLTLDFHTNKRIIDEVAILPSKRMRNKISGYTTHLMRRIAKGPVRGISLKLQEEERERRLDFVPEVSALEQETIQIDPDTRDLLESLGYGNLNGVAVNQAHTTRD
jgi:small subunit ribosomal protein S17e